MTKRPFERRASTVQRFAKEHDVHPVTVYRWIKTGELKALKIGGRTLVWLDSVPAPEEPK